MFQKARRKLSAICCLTMAGIVFLIILCCLHISEQNMYGQEKALFFLQANTISSDLQASGNISIAWYQRSIGDARNALSIEIDGVPSTLTSVVLGQEQQGLIQRVQDNPGRLSRLPDARTGSAKMEEDFWEYHEGNGRFLVMHARFFAQEHELSATYLYSLSRFLQNARRQRACFFAIWLVSILALYLFSYAFTSHVLQPLIQNDEKQKHFIAFASHELRSPLAVFKTGLSLLKNSPASNTSGRIFSLLDKEMSRMERLIQDLLCLVKMEQAGLHFQFQPVCLTELLQSVFEKYAPLAAQKQISLHCSIPTSSAPQAVTNELMGIYLSCDPQRIEQAVIILLDNALSYTPAGQEITLRLLCQRGKYCIQVIDTGIGIPDGEKKKIFDKFYRADPSRSQKEHFGLGLSIAREICAAHGGKLSVSDTAGGGSTFTISLPKSAGKR